MTSVILKSRPPILGGQARAWWCYYSVAGNSAINDWSQSPDRSDNPSFTVARSIWRLWYLGSQIDPVTQSLGDQIDLATQALSAGIDPVTQALGAQIDLVTQVLHAVFRSIRLLIHWVTGSIRALRAWVARSIWSPRLWVTGSIWLPKYQGSQIDLATVKDGLSDRSGDWDQSLMAEFPATV